MYYAIYEHEEKYIYYVINIREICRCSVIYVSGDICVLCDIYLHEMYTYHVVYLHEYINVWCYIFTRRYK